MNRYGEDHRDSLERNIQITSPLMILHQNPAALTDHFGIGSKLKSRSFEDAALQSNGV